MRTFGPRSWPTTFAVTEIFGATSPLPLPPTKSTSGWKVFPSSRSMRSTSRLSPSFTTYCFPPRLMIAYWAALVADDLRRHRDLRRPLPASVAADEEHARVEGLALPTVYAADEQALDRIDRE